MSNVAKLKKQAAELELKKQFDKALAIYIKLLDSFDENASELDVALFNRVGDLMLRQGNVADAVDYYEQAIDRYADTGKGKLTVEVIEGLASLPLGYCY